MLQTELNSTNSLANSTVVTFCAFMSQGNFNGGLPESALNRQVLKIKMDESEY